MMFSTTVMPPKSRMFWKVRAMRRAVISSGCSVSMRVPSNSMVALLAVVERRDGVEEGGLAGAVGADDADDPAPLDVDGHLVDGREAAEALDDVPGGEDVLVVSHARLLSLRGPRLRARRPARACRRAAGRMPAGR